MKEVTVCARLLAMATIKLFQVLVRLLFKFVDFLIINYKKMRPLFESGYKMCAASSHAYGIPIDRLSDICITIFMKYRPNKNRHLFVAAIKLELHNIY